jgi:beta-xylosidase
MMSDQRLASPAGLVGDGVGAAATRTTDGSAVQVLVYNHVDGGTADASKSNVVSLTLNNLPFTGAIRVRQYIVDYSHANAYRVWMGMGSPVAAEPVAVGGAARTPPSSATTRRRRRRPAVPGT